MCVYGRSDVCRPPSQTPDGGLRQPKPCRLADGLPLIPKPSEGHSCDLMVRGIAVFVADPPSRFDDDGPFVEGDLHPWLLHQDWLADKLGGLLLSVVHRRCLSMAWHTHQVPGKLAGIVDPDGQHGVLEWIQEVGAAWQAVERQASNWWVVARKRSAFGYLVVVKVPAR